MSGPQARPTAKFLRGLVCALAPFFMLAGEVRGEVICTLMMNATTSEVLLKAGACDQRMTPASTFKLPLAVIGYEAGFLKTANEPLLSYQPGDPDWGGKKWARDTTPRDWLRYSVVWYSQRITKAVGQAALARYVRDLEFGNADVSGDPGQGNGLEQAWLSSSLKISAREQAVFMQKLVRGTLAVSQEAMTQTRAIVSMQRIAGWRMYGKTGGAYPRGIDGRFDRTRGIGWYTGWAEKGDAVVVFVRLTQASEAQDRSPGLITRDAVQAEWADLVAKLGL